jgi:hypothetical protein
VDFREETDKVLQAATEPINGPSHDDVELPRSGVPTLSYMLGLSKDREVCARWQRACELLLAEADVGALSIQIELALFYDGRLVLT